MTLPASHASASSTLRSGSALLLFLPVGEAPAATFLAAMPGLSLGLMSPSEGSYSQAQMDLDVGQGARVARSDYSRALPSSLLLAGPGEGPRYETRWHELLTRAQGAHQILEPGLLASQIPGGAGYAASRGSVRQGNGATAADRTGRLALVSVGPAATLPARVRGLLARKQLVIADLSQGALGQAQLRYLSTHREFGELEIVVAHSPEAAGSELLWVGVGGLGAGSELTSQSTRERGLISAVDLAPTILQHLRLTVPRAMQGRLLELDGSLDVAHLRALKIRLESVYSRRLPALAALLGAWILLLLGGLLPARPRMRSRALRVGALAMLWTPVAVLIGAALEPGAALEYVILVTSCFALGAITDGLLGWPRAVIAPAVLALVALTVDALAGTQLLMRSLLGPNPAYGARFYGIGNELKSGLAVLALAAVAGALYPAARGRRAALAMALCGAVLAAVEGSAKIGAGVGSVILVSAGAALATAMLLEGAPRSRRALIAVSVPALALMALALLDLATAHGSGHFTGSVLDARSAGDLRDIILRRYSAAWRELGNGAMPVASALAVLVAILGILKRRQLLSPTGDDPAWLAALSGGLAAGVVGTLVEDSGPVLLVVATFALMCVLAYLWGKPVEVLVESRLLGAPAAGAVQDDLVL